MANDFTANDKAWDMIIHAAMTAFAKHCTPDTDAGKASDHVKAVLKGPVLNAFLDATPDDACRLLDMARKAGRDAAQMTK